MWSIGLLASAIIKMEGVGGLSGWRWIFILEGIVTVLLAVYAYFAMPMDLATARFLTEEEREFAGESPLVAVTALLPMLETVIDLHIFCVGCSPKVPIRQPAFVSGICNCHPA